MTYIKKNQDKNVQLKISKSQLEMTKYQPDVITHESTVGGIGYEITVIIWALVGDLIILILFKLVYCTSLPTYHKIYTYSNMWMIKFDFHIISAQFTLSVVAIACIIERSPEHSKHIILFFYCRDYFDST